MVRLLGMLLLLSLWYAPIQGSNGSSRSFPPDVQARLQEVLDELQQVEERLRPIRREAESSPTLSGLKHGIDQDLLIELPERFPEQLEQAERMLSLLNELTRNSDTPNDQLDRERKLAEFNELRADLQPLLREVRDLPEFSERIADYEQRVEDAMKEISPAAAELISRRAALHIQFNRLQREALQAMRGEEQDEESQLEPEPSSPTRWVFPPSRQRF